MPPVAADGRCQRTRRRLYDLLWCRSTTATPDEVELDYPVRATLRACRIYHARLPPLRLELVPPLPRRGTPIRSIRRPLELASAESFMREERVMSISEDRRQPDNRTLNRRSILVASTSLAAASVVGSGALLQVAQAQQRAPAQAAAGGNRPNIIVIMGDDIGWSNIGVYNQGIMAGRTPNLDRMANEGMRFTDYYAEASCTAGRANFITGELPIRTGLTTVGQAGAPIGIPDEAVTIAHVLKSMGYATGQFGKNHLGDLNRFLPTVHGFDEFWGYLYHLDAMEDPFHPNYPPALLGTVGPRNLVHSLASDVDDPTVDPRWG